MQHNTETERARAERIFRRHEDCKADIPKAVSEYYAAQQSIIERTRKLREERLAREAEQKSILGVAPTERRLPRTALSRSLKMR